MVFVATDVSENGVDKRDDIGGLSFFCLLHRLIDSRRFRNSIKEKNLIKSQTKKIQNRKGDLLKREISTLPNAPVEPGFPPHHPLDQLADEGSVPLLQVRCGPEEIVQGACGESGLTREVVQHPQGEIPRCLNVHRSEIKPCPFRRVPNRHPCHNTGRSVSC